MWRKNFYTVDHEILTHDLFAQGPVSWGLPRYCILHKCITWFVTDSLAGFLVEKLSFLLTTECHVDLRLVSPSGALATDDFSPHSSVLSRRFHLLQLYLNPAVPISDFLRYLFSRYSLVALCFCGLAVSTACNAVVISSQSVTLYPSQLHCFFDLFYYWFLVSFRPFFVGGFGWPV